MTASADTHSCVIESFVPSEYLCKRSFGSDHIPHIAVFHSHFLTHSGIGLCAFFDPVLWYDLLPVPIPFSQLEKPEPGHVPG